MKEISKIPVSIYSTPTPAHILYQLMGEEGFLVDLHFPFRSNQKKQLMTYLTIC